MWASVAFRTVVSVISQHYSAHMAYCALFTLYLIVACILRQVAPPLLLNIPWINYFQPTPDKEWFQTDVVLRVSLGNFLFFTILAVLMTGLNNQKDPRDNLYDGRWMMKLICWFVLVLLMLFLPDEIISFYGAASKFGAGFFLFVQVVLLLDFVHGWNGKWVGYNEQFWYIVLFVVSLICYTATLLFSVLLCHWFTPSGQDCGLDTFFIVTNLVFGCVFAKVELHPAVNGSIVPALVVFSYCTYLCYSGLANEPQDYRCNGLHKHSQVISITSLTFGLLTTILSVIYSAVCAGSFTTPLSHLSSPCAGAGRPILPLDKAPEEEKEMAVPVMYSYSFFHIIISLASMYSAVLLTGWSTPVGETNKLIDMGWSSVWIHITTEWAAATLYIWSLVAPHLFRGQEF